MAYEDVKNGEGRALQDKRVAIYRDDHGTIHAVSSVCTHQGCSVDWDADDHTWHCPCHGSRFAPDGHVLVGPATEPLPPRDLPV